jgi:ribose transport system substrate-binding protein
MKKKGVRAAIILLVLVTAFAMAACGSSDSGSGAATGGTGGGTESSGGDADLSKAYHLGVNAWGTAPVLQMYADEVEYSVKSLGLTDTRASDDNDADKELANIQNFISQGVDGLVIQGYGATTIPQMAQEALGAKVPFVLALATGTAEVRAELEANNEYYAGAVASDLKADGGILGEAALADGAKTAVIIGGNLGDLNMDYRAEGFTTAFEAGGGKVLDSARCTDNSEAQAKASNLLGANKDVDAVYILVGDYVEGTFSAIEQYGLTDIKCYLSAINAGSADFVRSGQISAGSGGTALAADVAPALLLNMLDGQTLKNDAGVAPFVQVPTSLITKANVDAYVDVFFNADNPFPVPAETIQKLTYRFNPDITYASFLEVIQKDFTVDAILKAAGK